MLETSTATLYSGAAAGAEEAFGRMAESFGLVEVNFTFPGHEIVRTRGLHLLSPDDLSLRDVSVQYVTRLMHRNYANQADSAVFQALLQSICWQVASGQEVFVVGEILPDDTVRGGTGWGAEFAKLCNKPLYVFDQQRKDWYRWEQTRWAQVRNPAVTKPRFTGTGTRSLTREGSAAVVRLFERSFRH